jgi:hypothetical protein
MISAAIGAALLLGACAKPDDTANKVASISTPPTASSTANANNSGGKSDEDKMREFAKCMRDHGVDMPDPETSPDGKGQRVTIHGTPGDESKVDAAQKACKQLLPNGGEMKKPDAAQLDKMRKDAKCMRDHGIDMPDPDPNGGAVQLGGPGQDEKKMEDAMKACGMGVTGGIKAGGQ